ncbi:hypothetical protein NQ317_002545, partial [Molorchus minor]
FHNGRLRRHLYCSAPEVTEAASEYLQSPGSYRYNSNYEKFLGWCAEKNFKNYSDNVLLAYFSYVAPEMKMKSSTNCNKKNIFLIAIANSNFLSGAPNEIYLAIKVVLVIDVLGACRCNEHVNMKIKDIKDMKTLLHIKITCPKTYKVRSFPTIVDKKFLQIHRKYASLRTKEIKDSQFYFKYMNGKCPKK